jgi:trehalose-6-phosphate synthase
MADVCIVSSLRDGFGLTGLEFVACQQQRVGGAADGASAKAPGVLVLSEFAGCAQSMASAIHFNPWATGELMCAIERAVTMSFAERSLRHSQSYRYVCDHDTNAWSRSFIHATSAAAAERIERARVLRTEQGKSEKGRALPLPLLAESYQAAGQRLLVLDMEGTLVRIAS